MRPPSLRRARPSRALQAALVLLSVIGPLLGSCTSAPPADVSRMVEEWASYMQRDYILQPGDQLLIHVEPDPDDNLTQDIVVPPNGVVFLRKLGDGVPAAGSSMQAFREAVQRAYGATVLEGRPRVTVTLREVGARSVYVTGEVRKPGPVAYVPGMTLGQAVASVGGAVFTAEFDDVRIVRAGGTPSQRTQRINYEAILHGDEPDYLLLPGDVVYVQTSTIADVGNWVELYVRRILPIPNGNPGTFFVP